ncbi:MAG: SRPBCC domain-containing protein [Casimicrobiaceae bacterium]
MAEIAQKPSLRIVRIFSASPETVWHACTDPQALKQWMGPSDAYSVPIAEADVRVGGRYHIVMKAFDGEEHDVSGVYQEVVPNRKLVYSWAWKSAPERVSRVTFQLRAAGDGTELTVLHEEFADADARERHNQGWTGCLGRLERLLGSPKVAGK